MANRKEEKTEFYEKTPIQFQKKPFVVVIQGKDLGKVYAVQDEAIIGRNSDCDIRLFHTSISRQHAKIFYDGGYYVSDLGSTNGIYIENIKKYSVLDQDQ